MPDRNGIDSEDAIVSSERRFVESESATTDHASNHAGATPIVVPLVIVGVLALLAYLTMSIAAGAIATAAKAQMGTGGITWQYQYGYDPYLDGFLDDYY